MDIKADTRSLEGLNTMITKQLDEFLLTMNGLLAVRSRIEAIWDDEQFGSFRSAMDKAIGAKLDVESGVIEIRNLIVEMIDSAERYRKA